MGYSELLRQEGKNQWQQDSRGESVQKATERIQKRKSKGERLDGGNEKQPPSLSFSFWFLHKAQHSSEL